MLSAHRVRRAATWWAVAAWAAVAPFAAGAQTPGLWHYTIETDAGAIPADMRINFPTVRFDVCLTADDFANGRAFSIQPAATSAHRCHHRDLRRDAAAGLVALTYACDDGATLSGSAEGRIRATRFEIKLHNRYHPPVAGVAETRQRMTAVRRGPC